MASPSKIFSPPTSCPEPKRGPVGRMQKVFADVSQLPRRQQDKIIELVEALVEQHREKGELKRTCWFAFALSAFRSPGFDAQADGCHEEGSKCCGGHRRTKATS